LPSGLIERIVEGRGIIRRMSISAENERYLQQLVERGVYRDRAEAIDEAVELLKRRDQLRSDVRAGIEQADRGELLDADEVFRRLEARARQIEARARGEQ
jgi:Arc/MetJ-type ribon-helix-helix transcriptional regulator